MPTFPTIKKDAYIFKAITCTVHRSLSVGTLPVHQMGWDWGLINICVKMCKNCFSGR